jgi:hypothetical protein
VLGLFFCGSLFAATTLTVTVIRGGSVFDPISGKLLPNRTVVIEGDRIAGVWSPERTVPDGAHVIDATGKYLIPGLIDAHVHLVHVLDFAHVTGDEIFPLFLAAGVTTVRDAGDSIVAEKLLARYAEAHPSLAPRVFLASPLIDSDPPYHRDVGWALADPAKVPAFVEDMSSWGVRTLKLYVGTERPVGRRIIEEGHLHGMVVTAHLGNYRAQDAVADGIDCLEHISSVFDYSFPPRPTGPQEDATKSATESRRESLRRSAELDLNNPVARDLVAEIVQHHVFIDPTLVVFRNMILLSDAREIYANPDNNTVPERLRKFWPQYIEENDGIDSSPETVNLRMKVQAKYEELTGIMYAAGVPLLAGTDAPEPFTPPGLSLLQELELLVKSGLPPAAVLASATIQNAQSLREANQLGSIEEGKFADLVILDANPLADIRNTRKIYRVIRGGNISDPRELLKMVPTQ